MLGIQLSSWDPWEQTGVFVLQQQELNWGENRNNWILSVLKWLCPSCMVTCTQQFHLHSIITCVHNSTFCANRTGCSYWWAHTEISPLGLMEFYRAKRGSLDLHSSGGHKQSFLLLPKAQNISHCRLIFYCKCLLIKVSVIIMIKSLTFQGFYFYPKLCFFSALDCASYHSLE